MTKNSLGGKKRKPPWQRCGWSTFIRTVLSNGQQIQTPVWAGCVWFLKSHRLCAFLWLKAAIVSSCYLKKYHRFHSSWSQPFWTGCLDLFFSPHGMNVHCFPITMKNVIRNKFFIKLNTHPQCKLWRPQSCLRGISQDSLQRSFNPISHPSGSTHFTQGTKNWHLQRNSRSLSILLTKRNLNLLGLISHDDSSFFHVEPSTGGCKNLKR